MDVARSIHEEEERLMLEAEAYEMDYRRLRQLLEEHRITGLGLDEINGLCVHLGLNLEVVDGAAEVTQRECEHAHVVALRGGRQ
jgi:hypothetical protein